MLTNAKISWPLPPPPHLQRRQHAPNNHVPDLVVICMLSLLHMSLSDMTLLLLWLHTALSLLGYVWPHIQVHLGLLHTTPQTRTGSPWVPSSWGIAEHEWDRECDHKWEREWDWGREHMPDVRDTGREHKHEWNSLRESSISCAGVCFVSSLFSLHFIFSNILFMYYRQQPLSHLDCTYFDHHSPLFNPTRHHSSCVTQKMTLCTILCCSSGW